MTESKIPERDSAKLNQLLEKLEKLDQKTWKRCQTICRDNLILYSFGPDKLPEWVLQGVICDAIMARGWEWQLEYGIQEDGLNYLAWVNLPDDWVRARVPQKQGLKPLKSSSTERCSGE